MRLGLGCYNATGEAEVRWVGSWEPLCWLQLAINVLKWSCCDDTCVLDGRPAIVASIIARSSISQFHFQHQVANTTVFASPAGTSLSIPPTNLLATPKGYTLLILAQPPSEVPEGAFFVTVTSDKPLKSGLEEIPLGKLHKLEGTYAPNRRCVLCRYTLTPTVPVQMAIFAAVEPALPVRMHVYETGESVSWEEDYSAVQSLTATGDVQVRSWQLQHTGAFNVFHCRWINYSVFKVSILHWRSRHSKMQTHHQLRNVLSPCGRTPAAVVVVLPYLA